MEEYNDSQSGRYTGSGISRNTKSMAQESAGVMDVAEMGVMPGQMKVTANISVEFEIYEKQ